MRSLVAAALLAGAAAARATPVVSVGGEPIALAAIDARCGTPCTRVPAELRRRKAEMLETLMGEALLAGGPPLTPAPVSDADVENYIAAHPTDFRGPPDRDRAAVRFFLEREARLAAERARGAEERARRPPVVHVGPDDPTFADPAPAARVLAEAGGRTITNGEVEARLAWPLYRLRGELALERRRAAEALVEEALWAREAAAAGTTPDALRNRIRRTARVTDDDVAAAVAAEAARRPGSEPSAARIRPYLLFRAGRAAEEAFLADAAARAGVRIDVPLPRPARLPLGAGAFGWHGPAGAPARVVFLTSHRGEVTRRMWDVVRRLAAEPGTAVTVRPLLPQWDPEATAVAVAVRCAAAAGRGWAFQDAVARHAEPPTAADLAAIAATLDLDDTRFRYCTRDPETAAAVAAESAEAERFFLDDPPALLVDGRPFTGMQSPNRLRAVARAARRRAERR